LAFWLQTYSRLRPLLQATEAPKQTYCLVWAYLGIMLGDVVGGLVSQRMQSRKKPMYAFLLLGLAATIFFLSVQGLSLTGLYLCYLVLGFAAGYWILMLTTAAEQFGTNIRSTVTVTIPNFIRSLSCPDEHGLPLVCGSSWYHLVGDGRRRCNLGRITAQPRPP